MPKAEKFNPIQTALEVWLPCAVEDAAQRLELLNAAPKRFTIYEPMAILPAGSFASSAWHSLLISCNDEILSKLWKHLLEQLTLVAKAPLTNLAINEGIPLLRENETEENILRSPSGLQMLHGNWGSSTTQGDTPTSQEFDNAFWVTTKQNGIHQTWAPRWTMFSRGNVKEKARLLAFGNKNKVSKDTAWAVDLYAGIGYFVFSYATMGLRVLGWELNPWSVEGLRRGALMNKWSIKVVQGVELESSMEEILKGEEQIIIFLQDNQKALPRIQQLQQRGIAADIRHVNGGFLPTSEPVWKDSWSMTLPSSEAWLHLHENVGVGDIDSRANELAAKYEQWKQEDGDAATHEVSHVEKVKTFAPGVWHCVFDIHIRRDS